MLVLGTKCKMVEIIIVAHPEIASSFTTSVRHILARRMDNLHILAVHRTENFEHVLKRAEKFVATLPPDREILMLTDIFGATPSNVANNLIKKGKVELITGLNL